MTIRKLIKTIRVKRGVSYAQLATAAWSYPGQIQKWENGEIDEIDFEMVMRMCEYLKIKVCAEHKVGYQWKRELLKS